MIHDMTALLVNPAIPWAGTIHEISNYFEDWVNRVEAGLYVQYFENDSPLPIYDKNRDFRHGGNGALVVCGHGASLKPGKFQNGFINRRRQDADHLHRTRADEFGATYRSSLKFCLMIDLPVRSVADKTCLKQTEKLLKRNIDNIIAERGCAHPSANRRGDWRKLLNPEPADDLKERMRGELIKVRQAWDGCHEG